MALNELPARVPAAIAPAQGERKIVTVLFADVVGSTTLAENLDPEEWGEIIAGMHALVSAAVTRYDGLVAQLLGDGALAFFGAPAAHEDDPERAVLAGLDLLASIKTFETELQRAGRAPRFQMRVGLNTGLVVVGNVGAGAHVEYLAVGDTVNLAARMQSAAEPGTVLIADSTARAVRHAFDLAALGGVEVKGKTEPVLAFRVLGPKARPESKRGIAGLDSPIVGRAREIATLSDRLRDLAAGQGQIVALIGEAGLGKSRLVAEVVQRSPVAFDRSEGRCVSFASTTPYLPILEALDSLLDLPASGTPAEKVARLRATLPAGDLPLVATLFGLPLPDGELADVRHVGAMEPATVRERMIAAVCSIFERQARSHPLALVFEDLHWADASTLEVLERLCVVTERAPLAIIAAFRPDRNEASWRFHQAAARDHAERYTPLFLEPLPPADARRLVANLLHIEDLPDAVRSLILARAEGNPFYVEEVIRTLLDAGLVVRQDDHWHATRAIESIALPDSLAGVISARLDRLDADAKLVAQTAAVVGRDFTIDLLAQVAQPAGGLTAALELLAARELIQVKEAGGYRFKHVLTQEAAYNSLLLSKRRALHRRAGEALAAAGGAQPAAVAAHFLSAQDPLAALPYLIAGGQQALGSYSTPEALALFTRAAAIAATTGDTGQARAAFEGLGAAQTLASDPLAALATYGAMEEFAAAHEDDPMRVSALNKLALVQSMWLGQFEPAGQNLDRAKELAQACRDRPGLAEGLVTRCNVATSRADFDEAVRHLDQLVDVGRELRRGFETAFAMVHSANSWTYMARFEKAWPAATAARSFAEGEGDLLHLGQVLAFSLPWCHLSFGDLDTAWVCAEQAAEMQARTGDDLGRCQSELMLAGVARWRGDYESALEHAQRSVSATQAVGLPFAIAMALATQCGIIVEIDPARQPEVLAINAQALDLLEHPMGMMSGGLVLAELGECALALGEIARAQALFARGLSGRTIFMYLLRPRCLLGAARVALAGGDIASARAAVAEARSFVDERQLGWMLPDLALAEGQVHAADGQAAIALDCYRSAQALAGRMGMRPLAERARQAVARL